ncbi:uncharacterized protein UHOD_11111 [Ustilago sp. UG-2017b]|nr:uncharacterized protein UHOD_11111 [Ustilago sp. UG-2017b]
MFTLKSISFVVLGVTVVAPAQTGEPLCDRKAPRCGNKKQCQPAGGFLCLDPANNDKPIHSSHPITLLPACENDRFLLDMAKLPTLSQALAKVATDRHILAVLPPGATALWDL